MRIIEPIEIDLDKPRHLLLTVGGLKAAERELNKSRDLQPRKAIFRLIMEECQQIDQGDMGMDFCEAILWAGMLHEDPALKLNEVGAMPFNLREIIPLVTRLITETYLRVEKPEEEETDIEAAQKKSLLKLNGTASSGVSPELISE
jgi:hypothetical protein